MKNLLLIGCFAAAWWTVALQQYRLLPTCDSSDDTSGPIVLKGDKGDPGVPGKAGPQGVQGSPGTDGLSGARGVNGAKGSKGDIVNCSELLQNLKERISRIEESLNARDSSSSNQLMLCAESNTNGFQTLSNGRDVFCNEGWTVFQHRFEGSVSFDRNWEDYKNGFGNLRGEFWLGLEQIHQLTNSRNCSLRIDLWNFSDMFAFAEYRSFRVDSERNNFTLRVSGFHGTAGDSLINDDARIFAHNNQPFSTRDRDNDNNIGNCALDRGGWWFNSCYRSKLNAPWGRSTGRWTNILWYSWGGWDIAMKKTMMKLRC